MVSGLNLISGLTPFKRRPRRHDGWVHVGRHLRHPLHVLCGGPAWVRWMGIGWVYPNTFFLPKPQRFLAYRAPRGTCWPSCFALASSSPERTWRVCGNLPVTRRSRRDGVSWCHGGGVGRCDQDNMCSLKGELYRVMNGTSSFFFICLLQL